MIIKTTTTEEYGELCKCGSSDTVIGLIEGGAYVASCDACDHRGLLATSMTGAMIEWSLEMNLYALAKRRVVQS